MNDKRFEVFHLLRDPARPRDSFLKRANYYKTVGELNMRNKVTILIIMAIVLPVTPIIDKQAVFGAPCSVASVAVNPCFSENLILKKELPDRGPLVNRINFEGIFTQNNVIGLEMSLAIKHGINPIIIVSLAKVESGHSPTAVSTAGAIGTMQLMPETALKELNVDPYSLTDNIDGGIRYLKRLMLRYGGNLTLALAAYNCGPTIIDKEQRVPEYAETKAFLQRFEREYRRYTMLLSNIPFTYPLHDIFGSALIRSIFSSGTDGAKTRRLI